MTPDTADVIRLLQYSFSWKGILNQITSQCSKERKALFL